MRLSVGAACFTSSSRSVSTGNFHQISKPARAPESTHVFRPWAPTLVLDKHSECVWPSKFRLTVAEMFNGQCQCGHQEGAGLHRAVRSIIEFYYDSPQRSL
eukprot:5811457-Amphidinium_carterae.1